MSKGVFLGIDCTTRWTNLGLAAGGKVLTEDNSDIGREQSTALPARVDALLQKSNIARNSVTGIAVTVGPGYFTGVRVGVSYACALAYGLEIKVVAVSSLLGLAYAFIGRGGYACSLIRARREYAYMAVFGPDASMEGNERYTACCEISGLLSGVPAPGMIVCPEGDEVCPKECIPQGWKMVRSPLRGGSVALIGEQYGDKSVDPSIIRGNYLREPDIGR